jgi:hypothetical protein
MRVETAVGNTINNEVKVRNLKEFQIKYLNNGNDSMERTIELLDETTNQCLERLHRDGQHEQNLGSYTKNTTEHMNAADVKVCENENIEIIKNANSNEKFSNIKKNISNKKAVDIQQITNSTNVAINVDDERKNIDHHVNTSVVKITHDALLKLLSDPYILLTDTSAIEYTSVLNDSGANIVLVADASLLDNGQVIDAGVSGINGDTSNINTVGSYGKLLDCYAGEELSKSIIPPQSYVESLSGEIALLHMQIQQSPPIHIVLGLAAHQPIKVLSVASPATSNIMVWTVDALEMIDIYEYNVVGQIKISCGGKPQQKRRASLNIEEKQIYATTSRHIDAKSTSKGNAQLIRACLGGMSMSAVNNQRLTGISRSNDSVRTEIARLALIERMSRFTRRRRPRKGERTVPYYELGFLELILVDVIYFAELQSTASNKGFVARGGYTAMLVAVDWLGRGAWVRPIRKEKQDFMGSLRSIFIEIVQFGKERGTLMQPKYIKCDKAQNQSASHLKKFLSDFKLNHLLMEPKSNDLKILDRYVRTLREHTNDAVLRCDGHIQFMATLMAEANRRLWYITSADGTRPSPYEMYTGVVPTIDFLYPPVGTFTLAKASPNDKVGCSQAIMLGINEKEGTYILWFPRTDAGPLMRSNTLFVTLPGPHDRITRMMAGQKVYAESMLISGHVHDVTDRLRGPLIVQDVTHPHKGSWYTILRNHINLPTKTPYECTCGKQFRTKNLLHGHWTLVKKTIGLDHPDVKLRPNSLTKRQKERHQDYKKLELEKLLKNPPKNTLPGALSTLANNNNKKMQTTSEYNLRNRTVDGSQAGEVLRKQRIDAMNKKTQKLVTKTGSTKSILRMESSQEKRNVLVECPQDGCMAKLPGETPTGRMSKAMKQHLNQHRIQDEQSKSKREMNPNSEEFVPQSEQNKQQSQEIRRSNRSRKPTPRFVNTASVEEAKSSASISKRARFHVSVKQHDGKAKQELEQTNFEKETKNDEKLHIKRKSQIGKNADRVDQHEQTSANKTSSNASIEIETWYHKAGVVDGSKMLPNSVINHCRIKYYGENYLSENNNVTSIYVDKLPSCMPMEEPYALNFAMMLTEEKWKTISLDTQMDPAWIETLGSDEWTIPMVHTAQVIIDPRIETGMKHSHDYLQMDKVMSDLKYANKKLHVPLHTRAMLRSPLAPMFFGALKKELDSLNKLGTWSCMKCPRGTRPVGSRFVYDIKWDLENDVLDKFKARLIAQGCSQVAYDTYDPNQISSPVMKASSMNAICIIAAKLGLRLHTLDVKNAYITAKLDEKIFIRLPSFLKVTVDGKITMDSNIVQLNKALYGLKNSSSAWFAELKTFLLSIGFVQSNQDPCVFTYTGEHGACILGTHVDDILSASTEDFFEKYLLPKATKYFPFGVTHGSARQFLGCMIDQDLEKGEVSISQKERIEKIAEMFNVKRSKNTPFPTGEELIKTFAVESLSDTDEKQNKTVQNINDDKDLPNFTSYKEVRTYYRSYTGNLVYMCCYGRPDIQAIVYRLARYQESPSIKHIMAVRRIISYLLHTKTRKLIFGRQRMDETLSSFSDSSFADCPASGRSTGGYCHFLFGSYLASRSFKMNCVTRSVTEAEFYTMSACAADSIYFRNLFNETLRPVLLHCEKIDSVAGKSSMLSNKVDCVPIVHSDKKEFAEILLSKSIHPFQWMHEEDTVIYGDNSAALEQSRKGPNKRSKHIRYHNSYIWEQMHIFERIRVGKIATEFNVADLQTKPLNAELFNRHARTIMGERKVFNQFKDKTVNYAEYNFMTT